MAGPSWAATHRAPRAVVLKRMGKAIGKRVMLPDTWEGLLQTASEKLLQGGGVGDVFDREGNEVDDIDVVALVGVPGDVLFVGEPGEPWRAPAVEGAARPRPLHQASRPSACFGDEACNKGAEEEGARPEAPLVFDSGAGVGRKRLTIFSLVCSFCQPWSTFSLPNILCPLDHLHSFKLAVGLAKSNKEMKEHTMHILSSWSVVSALILGIAVTLLLMEVNPESVAARSYPWLIHVFHASNFIMALGALAGPVIFGNVLLINCSACGEVNFDLFMVAAEYAFMAFEFFTIQMCHNLLISLALLGFMVTDSFGLAMFMFSLGMVAIVVIIFFINSTTVFTFYGGLFRENHRMVPFVDEGSRNYASPRWYSERKRDVVDGLAREVRRHKSVFSLLHDYATQGLESQPEREQI